MAVLGILEIDSIARGVLAMDAAVKAAPAELLRGHPIDPGKYLVALAGDVASVQASIGAGIESAGHEHIVDAFTLPNAHEKVVQSLRGTSSAPSLNAVGVIETFSAAAIVRATDAAVKAAPVDIATLHLALHIGGKGYAVVVGDVADVEASVDAANDEAGDALVHVVVIPNPYPETYAELLNRDPDWGSGTHE